VGEGAPEAGLSGTPVKAEVRPPTTDGRVRVIVIIPAQVGAGLVRRDPEKYAKRKEPLLPDRPERAPPANALSALSRLCAGTRPCSAHEKSNAIGKPVV